MAEPPGWPAGCRPSRLPGVNHDAQAGQLSREGPTQAVSHRRGSAGALDDHLHEETKFLKQRAALTAQEREVLDRLHQYRNAAYHRDTLEPDLISDLALAYRVLADELVGRHKPIARTMASSDPAPVVTPQQLRGRLVEGVDVDIKAMARRFHDHAVKRVQAVIAAAATAQHLLGVNSSEEVDGPLPDDDMARMLTSLTDVSKHLSSWGTRRRD